MIDQLTVPLQDRQQLLRVTPTNSLACGLAGLSGEKCDTEYVCLWYREPKT